MVGAAERAIDFFISRSGADAAFAAEIGRILEDAGHTVVLQQWDFANRNFMERMHAALNSGARVIALVSNEYLASEHCAAEWLNTLAHDPLNKRARLIVMRVDECAPSGLLTALAYWDLVPIRTDAALLRDVVRAAVKPGRHKGEATVGAQYWREARAVVHREIKATPSFTGRAAELDAIEAALGSGGAAAVTQPAAVHGLGGIGKSVLAREYAYRNQDRYAGVWWLNAAKPDNAAGFDGIETALVELGAVFIPGLEQAQDRAAAARKALDFIAHGGFEKPWLLVYDNVDDARALRDWAPAGNAQVLVTSRLGGWPNTVGAIEIMQWPLADAVRYLLGESGRGDLTEAGARTIAEELGCLPLALSHAAAYLRARTNVTAEKYVAALARRMGEAPEDAEYARAVFATFQEALDHAETKAAGSRAVLSLAAFYAPDAVPEELFQQPAGVYPPAMGVLADDPDRLDEAIGVLDNLSLIDFDPAHRVFSVHRLAQAAARDAVGNAHATWAESALRAMDAAFPKPEPQTWPQCERLIAHARAVTEYVALDSYELGIVLGRTGTYLQERAALGDVVPLYERCRDVLARLAEADPANTRWQRDCSVAHIKIGDVLVAQGNLAQALESYRASHAIFERLAEADEGNAEWQRDLSVSLNKVGDVLHRQGNLAPALESYRASLHIAERLAEADPGNAGRQRDLGISNERIGDALMVQGNLAAALKSYEAKQAIISRLAEADPGNATWQRDRSVAHIKIGDVLRRQGNLVKALESYRASLDIAERLTEADPGNAGWQRDFSVSHFKIGDVLRRKGNLVQALESYRASHAIFERLAEADPANAGWQRDFSVSHNKIGDILRRQGSLAPALESYRASLDIAKRLAEADAGNAGWQRDLSVSHIKIGDVLRRQGKLMQALESYRASHAIFERLSEADPGNAGWQRDLSVSHFKIGDVLRRQGNLVQALESYRLSHAIFERLAEADPGNAGWQHDVALSLQRIGLVAAESGERGEALAAFQRGLRIMQRLKVLAPGHAAFKRDYDSFKTRIAELGE